MVGQLEQMAFKGLFQLKKFYDKLQKVQFLDPLGKMMTIDPSGWWKHTGLYGLLDCLCYCADADLHNRSLTEIIKLGHWNSQSMNQSHWVSDHTYTGAKECQEVALDIHIQLLMTRAGESFCIFLLQHLLKALIFLFLSCNKPEQAKVIELGTSHRVSRIKNLSHGQ